MTTFSNTLIKASAGSGKTFQLSNRYLQLIFHGAEPETILATTFTRKAAGEILDRILERLADAADNEAKRRELSQYVLTGDRQGDLLSEAEVLATLARLVRNIHRLRVSTLDSFFQQIAGNLRLELGMPAGWLIMEEDDRSPLLLEGIRELLEHLGKERTVELMHLLFKGETRTTITREINSLLTDLATAYGESLPDAWRQLQRTRELTTGEIERLVFDLAKADVGRTQKGEPNKNMLKARDKDLAAIRDALSSGQPIPWEKIGSTGYCPKVLDGSYNYSRVDMPPSLCDVYDVIVQQVCASVFNRLATQTEAMGDVLRELTTIAEALKNRHRMFDFNDVTNRLAKTSLDDRFRQIAHRINANTRHLLLDEFQDTSPNQWLVLQPFAKRIVDQTRDEGRGTREEGVTTSDANHPSVLSLRYAPFPAAISPAPSFFCVGDVKQAIYGWRGGVAAIFDAIETDLGSLKEERLDKSFRSCLPVINTVNQVFENIGSNAALNDDADKSLTKAADRWAKRFETHDTKRVQYPGYCSLRTSKLPKTQFNENGEPIKPSKNDRDLAHLRYVIDEIVTLYRQSPNATIGVLTRTNNMVRQIIFGLRSEGIEASEEGGNSLDQSPAVELILSALSLADYPGNRVACYHLAHSPLGPSLEVTPENYRYEATMQNVALRIRHRLVTEGYTTVLHDWIEKIAPVCDERDLGRMIQLLEMASNYQRKAKIRTMPFINLVRAKKIENPSASPIKVMSIHKSKGLQFDIVILPELEAKLTGTKVPKVVVGRETPTSPVSTVLAYPAKEIRAYLPEHFQIIAEQCEIERVEESLCVLYVAMTRAIHELLMIVMPKEESISAGKNNDKSGEDKSFAKTMSGVLHAGLAPEQSLAVENALLFQCGDRDWTIKRFPSVSDEQTQQESAALPPEQAEKNVTIKLAAKTKISSKNLTRKTPSGQEGEGRVASDQWRVASGEWQAGIGGLGMTALPSQLATCDSQLSCSPLTWGTAIHACFEQVTWLEQGLPDRETLLALVTPIMTDADLAKAVVDAFYASCDMPEVHAALSSTTYRDAVPTSDRSALRWEVQNERRFWATPHHDVLLKGSIDRLVLLYDDSGKKPRVIGADIIDYKSDSIENDEVLNARVEYYAPQLAEYRKAVTAMYSLANERITTRLLFVRNGRNCLVK